MHINAGPAHNQWIENWSVNKNELICGLKSGDSGLGCERLRQDLRRRHVSAGVVLGLNKQSCSGLVRPQTTLNSAVPLWGSDPLAQEIEGLLDSASSNINNDSVLIRSQSVPLHQMLQQFQSQGNHLHLSNESQH